jgi:hypothetical protein
MSTPTTTATEAEASIAALNTTVDDAVNALTSAIEAAETVVAKFGMTIVRNKAPHFILEPTAAESPRKRIRFSDDIHAAAVGAAAAERAAELASSTEAASEASIAEAVTAAETATAAVEAAVDDCEAPAAIGRSLSG